MGEIRQRKQSARASAADRGHLHVSEIIFNLPCWRQRNYSTWPDCIRLCLGWHTLRDNYNHFVTFDHSWYDDKWKYYIVLWCLWRLSCLLSLSAININRHSTHFPNHPFQGGGVQRPDQWPLRRPSMWTCWLSASPLLHTSLRWLGNTAVRGVTARGD